MDSVGPPLNEFLPAPKQVAATDSVAAQISRHQSDDQHQSVLHSWLANVWDGGSRNSLEEMQKLKAESDQARRLGDKDTQALIDREATRAVQADQQALEQRDQYLGLASGAIQTTVLAFSSGRARNILGIVGSAGVGALDTMKSGDTGIDLATEGALGMAKGLALNGMYRTIGSKNWNPVNQGFSSVGTGLVSRFAEYASDSDLYKDGVANGFSVALSKSLDLSAMGVDASTGLVAGGIIRGAKSTLGARIDLEPGGLAHSMSTGSVFGLTAGASSEIVRERNENESFDLGKVVKNSVLQGAVSMLPGLAGYRRAPALEEIAVSKPSSRIELGAAAEQIAVVPKREFMVTGGVDSINALIESRMAGKLSAAAVLKVQEIRADNTLDHPTQMFVRHIENPKDVVTQNLIGCGRILAVCHGEELAPDVRAKLHVLPEVDGLIRLHANEAGDRVAFSPANVAQLDGFPRSVTLGHEPDGRQTQMLLYSWLKAPVNPANRVEERAGISDKKATFQRITKEDGWKSAMTEDGSAADSAGMDLVFVRPGDKKIVVLDFTKNNKAGSYSEFRNSTIFQSFYERPVISDGGRLFGQKQPTQPVVRGLTIATETKGRLLDHLMDAFEAPSILSTSDTLIPLLKRSSDPLALQSLSEFSDRLKLKQTSLSQSARSMESADPVAARGLRGSSALIRDYLDDLQVPQKFLERRIRGALDPDRAKREAFIDQTVKAELDKVIGNEKLTGSLLRAGGTIRYNGLHDEIQIDARGQRFTVSTVKDLVRDELRRRQLPSKAGNVETAVEKLIERLDRLGPQKLIGIGQI